MAKQSQVVIAVDEMLLSGKIPDCFDDEAGSEEACKQPDGDIAQPARISGPETAAPAGKYGGELGDDRLKGPGEIFEHYKKLYPDYFRGPAAGALMLHGSEIVFRLS